MYNTTDLDLGLTMPNIELVRVISIYYNVFKFPRSTHTHTHTHTHTPTHAHTHTHTHTHMHTHMHTNKHRHT